MPKLLDKEGRSVENDQNSTKIYAERIYNPTATGFAKPSYKKHNIKKILLSQRFTN